MKQCDKLNWTFWVSQAQVCFGGVVLPFDKNTVHFPWGHNSHWASHFIRQPDKDAQSHRPYLPSFSNFLQKQQNKWLKLKEFRSSQNESLCWRSISILTEPYVSCQEKFYIIYSFPTISYNKKTNQLCYHCMIMLCNLQPKIFPYHFTLET